MAIVLRHGHDYGLTQTEQLVLIGIANHDGDGGAWPSVATLARYARVERRSVTRVLRTLEGRGLVVTLLNGGGSRTAPHFRRPNLYDLRVVCPLWCDGSKNHRDLRGPGDRAGTPLWSPADARRLSTTPDTSVIPWQQGHG